MSSLRSWVLFAFTSAAVGIAAGPGCGSGNGDTGSQYGNPDSGSGDGTTGGGKDGSASDAKSEGSLLGGGDGATNDGSTGGHCTPRTCATLKPPVGCGMAGDGCGGVLNCGGCTAPATCGGGDPEAGKPAVPGQCGGVAGCVPKTCASYPAGTCGPQSDGCGGLTPVCNATCPTGQTCGGDPTKPGVCGTPPVTCVPKTCTDYPGMCGQQADGCGNLTTYCNPCTSPATCGGAGTPDKCGISSTSDASLCTPKTSCPAGVCGQISDGCGHTIMCATTCTSPQTCGGGGTPGQCGSTCTPLTACPAGTCGSMSDGCGGVINCATQCASPQTCGGGGTPGQCGSAITQCTPLTCTQACTMAGITTGCCGQFSDGCGGLTADCGGCVPPAICGGGGTASQCGDSNLPDSGTACTGLCGQIPNCGGGTNTTTVTGRVYAGTDPVAGYGAPDPIQHAHVFIPNDPTSLAQFGTQVVCACETASGPAIASTYSAIDGTFTLTNVPAGNNIPIVIQLGRWRRVFYTNITACTAGPTPGNLGVNGITSDTNCRAGSTCNTRMPRVEHEFNVYDNIPLIAEVTGSADSMECILPKIGIDGAGVAAWIGGGAASTQYSLPGGGGRVQFYKANGANFNGGTTTGEANLWGSTSTLDGFDMVVFDCEGGEHTETAAALSNVMSYANAGGRVFATHYSYVWTFTNQPWGCGGESSTTNPTPHTAAACTTAGSTVADWYADQAEPNGGNPVTAQVDNATMLSWLQQPLIGLAGGGTITLNDPRADTTGVIAPPSSLYLEISGSGGAQPLEFTWNSPPFAQPANQCGRVLFSDFHVYGTAGASFPSECAVAPLTAQEKVLEYEIFDLGDCVTAITPPPPPTCTKKTCANYPAGTCGDQSDGCGGFIQCLTCPTGKSCVNSQCVGNTCTKLTCANYPAGTCGQQSDGCGGVIASCGPCSSCTPLTCAAYPNVCGQQSDGCGGLTSYCNPCTLPQTCGGGGTPGVCGLNDAAACQPACPASVKCGPAGDGCGGTIQSCGMCPTGQTCGGGGTPGVCGAPNCTPKTCASYPANTCGQQSDGCGGLTKDCGSCPTGQTCGGGGTPGMCGSPNCTPQTCAQTCAAAGITSGCCGQFSDGCGGLTATCGTCSGMQTCGGGGNANVCGGGSQ